MTSSRFSALAVALTLTAALAGGCKEDKDHEPTTGSGTFSLEIDNVVGTQPLTLDTQTYTTPAGDNFTVGTFKYYLSNVALLRADGSAQAVPDTYFLVDAEKPASTTLQLPAVPAGDYTGLRFVVGVDSARTKAGNYTGVLTAENNMFWTMNGPEFINLKLEGTSPQSPTTALTFHVAGFRGANGTRNSIRTVTLPFANDARLLVRAGHTPAIHLKADVLGLFGNPHPVRFATVSRVKSTNPPAGGFSTMKMADNLAAGMFKIDHIHNSH